MKVLIIILALFFVVNGCDEANAGDGNTVGDDPSVVTVRTPTTTVDSENGQQHPSPAPGRRCDELRLFHEELQWQRLKHLRDHILSSLNLNKPPSANVSRPSEAMLNKIRIGSSMQMQSDSSLLNSLRTNKTPNNGQNQRHYAKHHAAISTTAEIRKKVLFSTKAEYDEDETATPSELHDVLKEYRLDNLRTHLLSELGLNAAPSNDVVKSISKHMRRHIIVESEFENTPNDTPTENYRAENLTSFISIKKTECTNCHKVTTLQDAKHFQKLLYASNNVPDKNLTVDFKRTYFHIVNMREYDVRNATLYFYIQQPQQDVQRAFYQFEVHVYRYTDGSQVNLYPLINNSYKNELHGGYWVQLNVTDLVHEWVKSPSKNFGIMIKAHHKGEDLVNRTVDDWNRTSQIFLHVEFNEEPIRRIVHHNHEDICESDRMEEKCCRYRLQVDFEAMGWDWIIAPKRYDAYYCAGTCPFQYKLSSPHTHLTQQLESLLPRNHRYRSIGPCCTPKEYQELKIIYISDAGTVHERRVPDMMVVRCGCA